MRRYSKQGKVTLELYWMDRLGAQFAERIGRAGVPRGVFAV